jgi:hypothetical protein
MASSPGQLGVAILVAAQPAPEQAIQRQFTDRREALGPRPEPRQPDTDEHRLDAERVRLLRAPERAELAV